MKRLAPIICVACLWLAGCASVGVTTIKRYPPRDPKSNLDIYTSTDEIKVPYEVICIIDSRTGGTIFDNKTAAAAIEKTKKSALKAGADAILIENADTRGASFGGWGLGTAIVKGIKYLTKK